MTKWTLSTKNINAYLNCPKLLYEFDYDIKKDEVKAAIRKSIIKIFAADLSNDNLSMGRMVTKWDRILSPHVTEARKYNDIILALKDLLESYTSDYYSESSVIAVNMPVIKVFEKGVFSDKVDTILHHSEHGIVPVFVPDHSIHAARDNGIRFISSILEEVFGVKITKYIIIKVIRESGPYAMNMYSFNKKELQRADSELKQVVRLITSGINIPNTNHCNKCYYVNHCRL